MPTPTRILRTLAEELDPTMRDRTVREERQFERIMKVAPTLLTFWHTDRISFTALAVAMKMAPATLRRHFVDIPALLGHLIREHLREINTALAQIPHGAPDRARRRRAAYLEFTRKPLGAYTEIHLLMLNNLPTLPDDLRLPLLEHQRAVATGLGPAGQEEFVLSMLDNPFITPTRLEAILATEETPWHEPAPQPEPVTLPNISGAEIPGGGIWIENTPDNPLEDRSEQEIRNLQKRLLNLQMDAMASHHAAA